jgi:hypothetical protein
MPFGEYWPKPQSPAHLRAADHNWRLLQSMGGGMVGTIRRAIDDQHQLAAGARKRGDKEAELRHDDEIDRLFDQLESYLSYVGGAR